MTSPLRWLRAALVLSVAPLPVCLLAPLAHAQGTGTIRGTVIDALTGRPIEGVRSEEHTSELQSQSNLVCRLLLEKKKNKNHNIRHVIRSTGITADNGTHSI